nr:putative reverse transcriptase domain-containing protein [Tanacetum cinerariifolium]
MAPPSPNYIPGPEEPEQAPPSPDYVLSLEHVDDEIVAEEQPYAEDASPITQSPEYKESSEDDEDDEDDDMDIKADEEEEHPAPADSIADGGDDGDDEEESSEDDEDDEMDIKADKEEEEEHPAPADSVVVAPTAADQAPSAEETEPFKTGESAATPPPHPAYRMTSRISIPTPVPMPAWTDSEVVRLLAISSPPASPLSPWSSPPPQIPFPPLLPILSPPSPVLSPAPPPSLNRSLGYRAAMIRLRDEAASTLSPPLQLPSASRKEDRPEVTLPPQKRLGIALGPRYEVGESSSATTARPAGGLRTDYGFVATVDREIVRDPEREVGYGITDSWDEIVETLQGAPVSTDTELGGYVREFETRVRQDTDEIYMRLDDEQTERQLLAGRLNMLFRDRRAHAYTRHLMETEARMSKEVWVRATDASDLVHGEVMSLRTTVLGHMLPHYRDSKDSLEKQMAPKRTTRSIADQKTINATSVTNAQLQALIDQGVTAALAARDALRSTNGDDSHNSGTGTEQQLFAGRFNMLFRDRRAHVYTHHLMETEARMSREAWVRATDASDLVHGEVMSLRTTVLDHRRSIEILELRTALQGQVTALQKQMALKRTTRSTADQETINATSVTNAQLQEMINQGVTTALASRDALRSTNGDDSHNSRTGVRRTKRANHECTYTEFLKCQPLPFKGTEGVASLSQWCERMESVFHISNCAAENQVKFATCTLHSVALTWMFFDESDNIEKYIGGLPDMIHGSVVASKPKTIQEAIEIATELMDKKIRTFAKRKTASKRKFKNTSRNTQNQQHYSNKRQNTGRVYTAASGEKKQYEGSKPLCTKCNYHHDGPCAPKCHNCNKIGHFARDCKSAANTNNANNQRGTGLGQRPACYECGVQGHFKRECPKLKNKNNHGNQGRRNNALARVYTVGRAGTDPNANVMMGTFLLNNRYASVLFDTGADRSFVSTTFSTQINVTPSTLDHCYDVKLADGRIIGLNTILRGCTLNILNHPFNIDLMPVELGSFDAIIGMDWLAKYQAVIVCAEKIVRIPWGNETLIIHGDGSNQGNATRWSVISCTKTEKYVKKGFPIFLAHITTKEVEDKSEKKRLEDVPIVRNFPVVFPEELPGLPPTRPVEVQIDLVPVFMDLMNQVCKPYLDKGEGIVMGEQYPRTGKFGFRVIAEFSYNNSYHTSIKAARLSARLSKLSSLGLSGGIGYQLASLTSLTDFDVSNNNFGNQIPFSLPPNLTSFSYEQLDNDDDDVAVSGVKVESLWVESFERDICEGVGGIDGGEGLKGGDAWCSFGGGEVRLWWSCWRQWGGDGSHGGAAMVVAAMMLALAARDSGREMASGGE